MSEPTPEIEAEPRNELASREAEDAPRARLKKPISTGVVLGAYPERREERQSKLDEWGRKVVGPIQRWRELRSSRLEEIPEVVGPHEAELERASESELGAAIEELRLALRAGGLERELVGRGFALVREFARRRLGTPHYDVQLMGGWVLLQGMVAEMQTGEGKTLTATLPACVMGLAGVPVHVITVNDYLAKRDAEQMMPIYAAFGLSVGVIIQGMDPAARRAAYACDITYCTNKEVAFDYLKDRIALKGHPSRIKLLLETLGEGVSKRGQLLHRGLYFAIVDEADSVLVDEARTPLIISEQNKDAVAEDTYRTALSLSRELDEDVHFAIEGAERVIRLLEPGRDRLEELTEELTGVWCGPRRREELVLLALSAIHLYRRDQHYLVDEDKVAIIDEYTGRVMPDRSWEHGLHQMIEAKEGAKLSGQQETLARISYQRFFSRYLRLSGMTGTASEVRSDLWSAYRLAVATIPTNRPCQRTALDNRIFLTLDEKWDAVVERIEELYRERRPVLVGTRSVEASEHLSGLLSDLGIVHRVLNARQDGEEAETVARAGEAGRVTVATNMAGRGTDIKLGEGAAELGGLYVLGTELHDAARIDRQLAGRCARQGDPGIAEFMLSLEDELCEVHGQGPSAKLAISIAQQPGAAGERARAMAVAEAQRAAGRLHRRMRSDLVKMDAQLESLLAFSGRSE